MRLYHKFILDFSQISLYQNKYINIARFTVVKSVTLYISFQLYFFSIQPATIVAANFVPNFSLHGDFELFLKLLKATLIFPKSTSVSTHETWGIVNHHVHATKHQ